MTMPAAAMSALPRRSTGVGLVLVAMLGLFAYAPAAAREAAPIGESGNAFLDRCAEHEREPCRAYVARLKEKGLDASDGHPFCALYRLGLLGVVRRNREQKDIQVFRRPHEIEHDGSKPTLPAERLSCSRPSWVIE